MVKLNSAGVIRITRHLELHILLIPLIFAAYIGGYLPMFLISWLSALLHEGAHITALKRLNIPVSAVVIQPFGVCARLGVPIIKSPSKEILMALAGPFCNLAIAVLLSSLNYHYPCEPLQYGINANIAMLCLNLLPCLPLDGGRIMRAVITLASNALCAMELSLKISRVISAGLLSSAVYLLLTSQFNFSLILIGAFLLGNLCFEQKNISLQTMRELLYYKEKPVRDSFTSSCILTAYWDLPARKLLRRLSYNKYYIIHVLDKNGRIIKTLTEGQIISGILNKSIKITLGEI